MNKAFLILLSALTAFTSTNAQLLVGAWDFQTTTTGGTATSGAPSTPKVYVANFGSGTLYLDGSNGSSNWLNTSSNNELTSFSGLGSSLNTALPGGGSLSTSTTGFSSLAFVSGADLGGGVFAANGKKAVFRFSMTGMSDLNISYDIQRNLYGAGTQTWDYSTDGTNWFSIGSSSSTTTLATRTLSTVTGLNNAADAYVRVTFTGFFSGGNTRMDNVQLQAVPEPSALSLLAVGLGGLAMLRRRRS